MAFYSLKIDKEILFEANQHSKIRMNYEYDRFKLSSESRLNMIMIGTIGQLIFRKYLMDNKIDFKFEYQAGKFDNYDFKIANKIFEVKTSGFKKDFKYLNLLYSRDQYISGLEKKFNYCIQIFINGYEKINKKINLDKCNLAYIAGGVLYKEISLYKNTRKFYGDDYKVPLDKLTDIRKLLNISHF